MKAFFLFCLYFCLAFAKHELYDGYVVYEVYAKNIGEIAYINNVANELTLDIWSYVNIDRPGQIFVSEPLKEPFEKALQAGKIAYKAAIENIKELLELETQKFAAVSRRNSNSSDLTFDRIYTDDEVNEYLDYIATTYPDVAKLHVAGHSFQGRPIRYVEISSTGFQNTSKPVIVVQSLLHAREWVTLPITLYTIHKLVVNVTETDLLNIDWIVMPVVNPDGYRWSHSNARFWRKNRRTGLIIGDVCVGVDLNRNFNSNWATESSNNVCSDVYHGVGPASEPETRAVSNVLHKHIRRMPMFLDMHSAGSMILYGWANGTLISNALMHNLVAVKMAQAIDRVKWASYPNYVVGNVAAVLNYRASGGCSDYGHHINIPYSFTYEMPALLGSSGVNIFLVDPAFVEQSALETWEGVKAGARHVLETY